MKKIKIDGMLVATFLTTMFYSATYPYIHKEIMANVTDTLIAVNQIINCVSIILWGWVWNRYKKLFSVYAKICILETALSISSMILVITTHNIVNYYIIDTLIFSIVTRNIVCGGIRLKCMRYQTEEERERFDNNNNSMSAVATILGSLLAIIIDLSFPVMIILATIGNAIDNVFYIFIYRNSVKHEENENVQSG